ncbi:hypothetical protein QTP88_007809 [Uroleucon formosanum]
MEDQYLSCTKEEVRAVIRFLNFQNVSPAEIHRKITKVYGPNVMSRKSVSVWCSKFNLGRESVEDEARSSRLISTSTTETIQAVEKLLRLDRRLKIREMATKLDLPKTTVHEIVHGKLNFRKEMRYGFIIATNETQRLGSILNHQFQKNETINANRYIETLEKLKEKIRFKRRGQLRSGNVKLLHDNATPHSAGKTKAWLEKYNWEVLKHPPYSPDLAPSDFFCLVL